MIVLVCTGGGACTGAGFGLNGPMKFVIGETALMTLFATALMPTSPSDYIAQGR